MLYFRLVNDYKNARYVLIQYVIQRNEDIIILTRTGVPLRSGKHSDIHIYPGVFNPIHLVYIKVFNNQDNTTPHCTHIFPKDHLIRKIVVLREICRFQRLTEEGIPIPALPPIPIPSHPRSPQRLL